MRLSERLGLAAAASAIGLAGVGSAWAGGPETDRVAGAIEVVAEFGGPMPTGVTVSDSGRVFVCYPRWGDKVESTVAEVVGGRAVAYPPGGAAGLLSVQSVVVDAADRLWMVETGSVEFGPTSPGGPKLIAVDLKTDRVSRTITFPTDVALPSSYLNDVRFDLRRGTAGLAFLTDSAGTGPNCLIVVDLGTGRSWRRLHDHPSTKAQPEFLPIVEGRALLERPASGETRPVSLGADGIAIGRDGTRLYYCPLASRRLYSVGLDTLADPDLADDRVAATVVDHGEKGASDGLESDDKGRIYATSYEHDAILRRLPDGSIETLVHDPRVLWPDTMSVARDGYLYFTSNQLHRQARFQGGRDLRRTPYVLWRTPIDAGPVRLAK